MKLHPGRAFLGGVSCWLLLIGAMSLLADGSTACADEAEADPVWSVRAFPYGNGAGSRARVFHRVSRTSDLGCDVAISWNDSDSDYDDDDTDGSGYSSHQDDQSHTAYFYPEWRRWSGIWGERANPAVRSYWGVRLVVGVSDATEETNYDVARYGITRRESERHAWSVGGGVTLGMAARVWGPVSFSAAVDPLTVVRTHDSSTEKTVDENQEEPRIQKTVREGNDTKVSLDFTPSLYVVLSW
ncbi:MAG: hypothetical protein KC729_02680 [Candidatus Eisenbacteria bacterium]|uniref:DUF481 domain-containing protein n=1 Tax=Eiseniibacteriota bacterium TaxID=2212470 RepID=A0A956LWB9_UNCEI|nr:hypothetical protein [Candidatus Eisenbacteria bacterium]